MLGISESLAMRPRTASASTAAEIIARMASEVCAAVAAVTGSNSVLPTRARPVDSDSYCGSNESPSSRGHQHERGAVLDTQFVESFGDIESNAVGLVQFVADAGFQSGQASPFEFVIEQLDDVVDEDLDRHRRRINLRDKMFATYDRNCATRRKCDLRH